MNVDFYTTLFLLPPLEMTALHLYLDAQQGCRRCISKYAQTLASARIKQTRGIQGPRWFPGLVVYPLYFSLFIVNEQPERILQLWNHLECNFCVMAEISDMGWN